MVFIRFFITMAIVIIVVFDIILSPIEVHSDISEYNNYIGVEAEEKYRSKRGMDETIFPKEITADMEIEDYKMVYYNPWDEQFLSYLVVNYGDEQYMQEVARLADYDSTEYVGVYGVTGFTKYELLAIYTDGDSGFIYAISDKNGKIIYVELIFCNYFYDLNYEDYINKDFLPDGFDAKENNAYRKEKLDV